MDDISKSIQSKMAEDLSIEDENLTTQIVSCLRSKCQKVIAQCRSSSGPCDSKSMRLGALRRCRPIKAKLMEGSILDACERKVGKMANGAATKGGYIVGSKEDFDAIINRCKHNDASKHPEYITCFERTVRDLTVACAALNCSGSARHCVKTTCKVAIKDEEVS